ncbi:MAG TPA: chemotaxis protein CheD [Solirubrobacteraceae bacterium]|nr:chemotaxis protein CheD [Solirubrobacteraceae bacterium]
MTHARIGEIVVSRNPDEELVALGLGSCIGVAMTDAQAQVAGLVHVMLPDSGGARGPVGKFADTAVPELLTRVLGLGAARSRLRVAIAGGAAMFGSGGQLDIGARNAAAVRDALTAAGLRCHAEETGGTEGRTLRIQVGSGATTVRVAGGTSFDLLPAATGALAERRTA